MLGVALACAVFTGIRGGLFTVRRGGAGRLADGCGVGVGGGVFEGCGVWGGGGWCCVCGLGWGGVGWGVGGKGAIDSIEGPTGAGWRLPAQHGLPRNRARHSAVAMQARVALAADRSTLPVHTFAAGCDDAAQRAPAAEALQLSHAAGKAGLAAQSARLALLGTKHLPCLEHRCLALQLATLARFPSFVAERADAWLNTPHEHELCNRKGRCEGHHPTRLCPSPCPRLGCCRTPASSTQQRPGRSPPAWPPTPPPCLTRSASTSTSCCVQPRRWGPGRVGWGWQVGGLGRGAWVEQGQAARM